MKDRKKICISFLIWAGCQYVVAYVWSLLEKIMYGSIRVDDIDTIIGFLFSLALWKIVRGWYEWKDNP